MGNSQFLFLVKCFLFLNRLFEAQWIHWEGSFDKNFQKIILDNIKDNHNISPQVIINLINFNQSIDLLDTDMGNKLLNYKGHFIRTGVNRNCSSILIVQIWILEIKIVFRGFVNCTKNCQFLEFKYLFNSKYLKIFI